MIQTHRSFKAYCANLWWRWLVFLHFSKECSTGGMKLTGENRNTRGKTCPSATLSTINPTWIDQGSNTGLRGGRRATNRLSHDTAVWTNLFQWHHMRIKSITTDTGRPRCKAKSSTPPKNSTRTNPLFRPHASQQTLLCLQSTCHVNRHALGTHFPFKQINLTLLMSDV